MTFEEWWRKSWGNSWKDGAPVSDWSSGHVEQSKIACKEAWDCQQERIDELNECLEQALSALKYWEEKAVDLEYDKIGV